MVERMRGTRPIVGRVAGAWLAHALFMVRDKATHAQAKIEGDPGAPVILELIHGVGRKELPPQEARQGRAQLHCGRGILAHASAGSAMWRARPVDGGRSKSGAGVVKRSEGGFRARDSWRGFGPDVGPLAPMLALELTSWVASRPRGANSNATDKAKGD